MLQTVRGKLLTAIARMPGLHRRDQPGYPMGGGIAGEGEETGPALAAALTHIGEGIAVFDPAHRLIAWNRPFLAMTGFSPEGPVPDLDFDGLCALLSGGIGPAAPEGAGGFDLIHSTGRVSEICSQPLPGGGFVTVWRDQSARTLEARAQAQAGRIEALSRLSGAIAHEFNIFLAAISGNLQVLQEQLFEDPDLSLGILRALDATERAAALTGHLLSFSGQQLLQPEPTRLDQLIGSLLDLLDHRLSPSVTIRAAIAPDLPPVLVDPRRMESALLALLFNSRDALENGGEIRLSLARAGDSLSLILADDGAGMGPERLARIFEPFFTSKESGRGPGLGLSMVYGFVSQSGGQIFVKSQPGQGTEVEIRLPLAEAPATTSITSPAGPLAPQAQDGPPPRGKGERILLVEDDPLVRDTAADMLQSLGYRVEAAEDLKSAREAMDGGQFDLIFTDLLLPDRRTGLDVARVAAVLQRGVPVLFTSGHMQKAMQERMTLPEGMQMLQKPYRKSDLAQAVRASLAASDPRPPPHAAGEVA